MRNPQGDAQICGMEIMTERTEGPERDRLAHLLTHTHAYFLVLPC